MTEVYPNALNFIVFEEENGYSAVCLEHWIVAQGKDIEGVKRNLQAVYRATLDHTLEKTGKPFGDIPPAPQLYQDRKELEQFVLAGKVYDKKGVNSQFKLAA